MRPMLIACVLIVAGIAGCELVIDTMLFLLALLRDGQWAHPLGDALMDLLAVGAFCVIFRSPSEQPAT